MSHQVTIENDAIQMDIWPQYGGRVTSLLDKADHTELLFEYPVEYPESSQYDRPYQKGWYAGWDECFPAIAPSRYVGHPYDGIPVPDHGEIWSLPATASPTKDGIVTIWYGLRFGYRLTRKLFLEGSSVVSEYTLNNLAPLEFRFVWAMHPLMAMNQAVEIELPGSPRFRLSHDEAMHEMQQEFAWPVTEEEGQNLSKPNDLPPKRGWKAFSALPITSPIVVKYPARSRKLTMEYKSEDGMAAHWGIWINTGGWGTHRHFSIQPTTGRFDQLDRAIKDGSAGTVSSLGKRVWTVRVTLASM